MTGLSLIQSRITNVWPSLVNFLNSSFISIYKAAGFVVLGAIVLGMMTYLLTSAFYMLNRSWAMPSVLSPSTDKVMQAHFNFLDQSDQLHKKEAELQAQQRELDLVQIHRGRYETYATNLTASMSLELEKFKLELSNIRRFLAQNPVGSSKKVGVSVKTQSSELQKQYRTKLISLEEYSKGLYDAARISKSQFDDRQFVADLKTRALALDKIITESVEPDGKLDLSKFVASVFATGDLELIEKYQIYSSTVQRQEELSTREQQILAGMQSLEQGIAQLQSSLKLVEATPDVRAASQIVYTAFVPYENLRNINLGDSVYGCYLYFVICKKIGEIETRFTNEIIGKHPISSREMRGQMIELKLTEPKWAESSTLFVGRAPLFI